jgi:hypothetical protein
MIRIEMFETDVAKRRHGKDGMEFTAAKAQNIPLMLLSRKY